MTGITDPFLLEDAAYGQRVLECVPYPDRWAAFHAKRAGLSWTYFPFDPASTASIPTSPGVYCFFVGLPPDSLPAVGYPLYVGKTDRTLQKRFTEYLKEEGDGGGRYRVRRFLKIFHGGLFFAAAPYSGTPEQVLELETEIMEALMPVYSVGGYTAETRARRSAW